MAQSRSTRVDFICGAGHIEGGDSRACAFVPAGEPKPVVSLGKTGGVHVRTYRRATRPSCLSQLADTRALSWKECFCVNPAGKVAASARGSRRKRRPVDQ